MANGEDAAGSLTDRVYVVWLRLWSRVESVGAILRPSCPEWISLQLQARMALDTVKAAHARGFTPLVTAAAVETAFEIFGRLNAFAAGKFNSIRDGQAGESFARAMAELQTELNALEGQVPGVMPAAAAA